MENAIVANTAHQPLSLPDGNDHAIVDLPFIAVIDGRQFRGRGLSLVAAYVAGLMDPVTLNETRIVRLVFQFDGFSVSLVLDAEIREGGAGPGDVALIFSRPTGEHLPQLRHVINAYIAGDLVGVGQTIAVAGTAAPKAQKAPGVPERRFSPRRVGGALGLGLLSLALVSIAGTLAYQRLFVTLVPGLGTVVSTGEVMRSTTTGQIVFLDLAAGQGDVAVAIQSASGDVQSLVLPCDCTVTALGLREGSTVLIGEPVLTLGSDTDQVLVSATVPSDVLFDLSSAARIQLTLPGGQTVMARIEPSQPVRVGTQDPMILLRPDVPLGADRVGDPAQIRILQNWGGLTTWSAALRTRISTLFEKA